MAAATNNMTHVQLPKLNRKDYDNWSIELKVFFCFQELWSVVERGFTDIKQWHKMPRLQC